jgi:hypothetical protein
MADSNSRAADASIAGYLYQFDKSILEVLKASDGSAVVLEGYEDVDLRNPGAIVAIQCKYHEAGKFALKGIRDPLRAMLKTFDEGHEFQYRLYGHYGKQEEEIPKQLTLEELKMALTKEGREGTVRYYETYSTATLQGFIDHFEIIEGSSRSDQREALLTELKGVLGGSDDDARDVYYPNAVSMVLDIAANPDEAARTVQRADFLDTLDKRKDLFTRWHREFLGTERYLKSVERRIKSLDLVKSTLRRMIILGSGELASASTTTRAIDVIKQIANLRFGVGHLAKARPWTVILEAEPEELTEIKEALIREGLAFGDGFENLLFSPEIFERPVIINTGKQHKKISAVSFDLRLVGLSTLEANAQNIAAPDVLLSFRGEPVDLPWVGQSPRELNVAGCDLDQLAELVGRLS